MNRHPAAHCAIHLDIEPGHEIDGREPVVVIWTRSTYLDGFAPRAYVAYGDTTGQDIPTDLLPSWVPRPPAAWLTVSEELRDAAVSPLDALVADTLADFEAGAEAMADRFDQPAPMPKMEVVDLVAALKASVEAAKERRAAASVSRQIGGE